MSEPGMTNEETDEVTRRALWDDVNDAYYRAARRLLAEARAADKPICPCLADDVLGTADCPKCEPNSPNRWRPAEYPDKPAFVPYAEMREDRLFVQFDEGDLAVGEGKRNVVNGAVLSFDSKSGFSIAGFYPDVVLRGVKIDWCVKHESKRYRTERSESSCEGRGIAGERCVFRSATVVVTDSETGRTT